MKGTEMKASRYLCGSLGLMVLAFTAAAPATAAPRAACSIVPLAEVRAIVGAPVVEQNLGSFGPTASHGMTTSNCTYGLPNGSTAAKVTLTWGPHEKLVQYDQFYEKRHKESPSIKGDVFVLAAVLKGGTTYDHAAGQKLLAAALAKI